MGGSFNGYCDIRTMGYPSKFKLIENVSLNQASAKSCAMYKLLETAVNTNELKSNISY